MHGLHCVRFDEVGKHLDKNFTPHEYSIILKEKQIRAEI